MTQIEVIRLGFPGFRDGAAERPYDGCEYALESALQKIEQGGGRIVSVSVLRSTRDDERHEAYVVYRPGE